MLHDWDLLRFLHLFCGGQFVWCGQEPSAQRSQIHYEVVLIYLLFIVYPTVELSHLRIIAWVRGFYFNSYRIGLAAFIGHTRYTLHNYSDINIIYKKDAVEIYIVVLKRWPLLCPVDVRTSDTDVPSSGSIKIGRPLTID